MTMKKTSPARRVTTGILLVVTVIVGADITATVVPNKEAYTPGDTAVLAMVVTIPSKYHLYGNPLGPGIGKPLKISAESEGGFNVISLKKSPASKYTPEIGEWVWAYEDAAWFFIEGVLAGKSEGNVEGAVIMDGLICHTACVPFVHKSPFALAINSWADPGESVWNETLEEKYGASIPMEIEDTPQEQEGGQFSSGLSLDVSGVNNANREAVLEWDYDPVESGKKYNIFLAVLFAFLAGIILNFMPCVLPVLGVKILSFSHGISESRLKAVIRSLVFAAGMMVIFMALAALAAFAGYSWGEQFQNPKILVGIIGLIFVFALGMFDVYMILVPSNISNLEQKTGEGLHSDFLKGMFATILATPCSGPFLGATLAWTLTQPPLIIFGVFASVGAGMAFPYILLSSSKTLARHVPKPGKWMEDFKHVMGFLLLGFAVYLMIGLPKDMIISTVGLCVFLATALWFFGRIAPFGSSAARKIIATVFAASVIALGIYVNFGVLYPRVADSALEKSEEHADVWETFSPGLLRAAHASGRHVVVDFTASWCMNCQFNKIAVLHSKKITNLLRKKDVLALKADITSRNEPAETLLHHLGSRSVPFFAVFPGHNPYEPIIMRDLLDKKKVTEALKNLPEK
ncbi:MAG: hypothetical protein GF401_15305 [Chitinivibrionales bacterium]|nr:hypothetical protein [Chitinivibrionales bacterium]